MRTEKIVWGLVLIFTGSIFLLENLDVINFYWGSVWRFWPVIFILIGANMLLSRFSNSTVAPLLAAAITILILSFIGYHGLQSRSDLSWFNNDHKWNERRERNGAYDSNWSFTEPYTAGILRAQLNIQGGAVSYRLDDTTSNLFDADIDQRYGRYTLERVVIDSVEVLNFRMRDKGKRWRMEDMNVKDTRMRLNSAPVWDIKVEMGAGEAIFDLTSYKVRKLTFEGGAASFEAKLGSKEEKTDVVVETGVANVEIEVPSTSGCRIVVDSGLSSKDFSGFIKQADGTYETGNYSSAVNKIDISLRGGLSSFEVRKY